jgi:cellulose synthase operon protein C
MTSRRSPTARAKSVLPVATLRSGRVPKVAEVSPYGIVGVTPSKHLEGDPFPPYVGRDVDHLLDKLLRQRGVALVTGASKAGKSRTAFEAVRRVFPASKLIVPTACTKALTSLLGDPPFGRSPDPPVLWLDELDRFLGDVTGFDQGLLDWLERGDGRMVIVGTVNLTRREDVLGTEGQIGRAARLLLEHADQILVSTHPSRRERAEAERLYPCQPFVRGIGEELLDTAALERAYDAGRTAVPIGWALLQAAVDWRRAGMLRPIPEADLRDLCPRYLDTVPTAAQRAEGLAWACRQVAPQIALLRTIGRQRFPSFRPFDHIVAYADWHIAGPARRIPHGSWEVIVAKASPEEAARVGFTAYTRGDHVAADAAWSRASSSGDQEVAPWSAQQLRLLRGRPKRTGLARPALERLREPKRSTSVASSNHRVEAASEIPNPAGPLAGLDGPPHPRPGVLEHVLAARRPDAAPVAGRTADLPPEEQGRDGSG